jgi:hypothetical protein
MNHLTEEQIVLHYYGNADDEQELQTHLKACSACREELSRVRVLLQQIPPIDVPEPLASFEEKTWLRVRDRLPIRRFGLRRFFFAPPKWALASLLILLVAGAFLAGRFWPRHDANVATTGTPAANSQRVVLVAVGGHLQRSQMLLMEVMHTDPKGTMDLSSEQELARDLLDDNHLYRMSAQRAGDPQIAALLDELGRVLAEIANSPSQMTADDMKDIHQQIESEGLLFKVRVVGSDVNSRIRRQEQSPAAAVTQRL